MLKTVKIQKESDNYKATKTSKDKNPSSKHLVNKELKEEKKEKDEKEYIQGEEHIPEHEKSNQQENSIHSNNPEEENEPIEEEDTKNKKIILKPREIHLKEQMSKMNFDNTVLSGINKGIEVQLKSIKDEMLSKNVAFRNNQKIINKSFDFSVGDSLKKENFDIKKKFKEIKELKDEKDALNRKLMQIIENENLIDKKNNSDLLVEQNLRDKIKKDVSKQKKEILDKIDLINSKIKLSLQSTQDANTNRFVNLKNFIDNFQRDKEIAEIRAKKYLKENLEIKKHYFKNVNQLEEKLKKELLEKDKEEKENQKQYVLRLKKQAKDRESKQSKKIEEKSLLYKPFINQKVDKTKNYLFMKQYQKFINNEKKLIDKENNFRKNYMKPISNEEIDEFNVKMDKKREEKKLISEEKSQKLQEEWKERKKTIPEYISPLYEKAYEDITNDVIRENANKEQRNYLLDKKKDYSLEVRNSHVPKKNLTLEQKRLTTISNLDPKRFLQYKDTLQHHKRKGRVLLKKVDPNKPNKYDWLKMLNHSSESQNEMILEEKLIKKPKNYMLSMSMGKSRNILPRIKQDSMKEIKKKEENDNIDDKNDLNEEENYVKSSSKKWDKLINSSNDVSLVDNISKARQKIEKLEYEALENEKLLKSQDDINQNTVVLNKKVSNLIIDSIQAKITLLQQMK